MRRVGVEDDRELTGRHLSEAAAAGVQSLGTGTLNLGLASYRRSDSELVIGACRS
jgi:hypothetical protein